mmetsp:Transcript_16175/g.25868  ORF Transcript_16175/g.25868 Transcript_16175/m.25868 type:complete len:436 (+) Transcript_16175:121-1428(+)
MQLSLWLLGATVAAAASVASDCAGPNSSKSKVCTSSVSLLQAHAAVNRTTASVNRTTTRQLPSNASHDDVAAEQGGGSVNTEAAFEGKFALLQHVVSVTSERANSWATRMTRTGASSDVKVLISILGMILICIAAAVFMANPEYVLPRNRGSLAAVLAADRGAENRTRSSLRLPSGSIAPRPSSAALPAKAPSPWPVGTDSQSPTLLGRLAPAALKAALVEADAREDSEEDSVGAPQEVEFCPDLVVPRGCECVLLVPVRPVGIGPFNVCDPNGQVVLRVLPKSSAASSANVWATGNEKASGQGLEYWYLQLESASGKLLAQCCRTWTPRSPEPDWKLLRADGAYHASLKCHSQDSYQLLCKSSARIHFWGSFDHHAVNITDQVGELLATTELCAADFDPSGEYYRLRVAPLADVGLLLSSLLCIDHAIDLSRRT